MQQSVKINDDWTSAPDNDFAADVFTLIGWDQARPMSSKATVKLCPSCQSRNPEHLYDPVCDLTVLQQRAGSCDLCSVLQYALNRKGIRAPKVVALRQDLTHVGLSNGGNLLSLYGELGEKVPQATHYIHVDAPS